MEIKNVDIEYYHVDGLKGITYGEYHEKSLPFLSVVQSTVGSYKIKIDSSEEYETGQMGAFIAPANKMQYIKHCIDPKSNIMCAHWIFVDVVINKIYRFDDLFDLPIILPAEHQKDIYDIINILKTNDNVFENHECIYKLLKILSQIGKKKEIINDDIFKLTDYVKHNYIHKITVESLAAEFNISVPTLFRVFKKHLSSTPIAYINNIRLAHASSLLQTTMISIDEIASVVGICDRFYLSRLFKTAYGVTPVVYRKKMNLK